MGSTILSIIGEKDVPFIDPRVFFKAQISYGTDHEGKGLDMPRQAIGGRGNIPLRIGQHEKELPLHQRHGIGRYQFGRLPGIYAGSHQPHLKPHELGRVTLHQLQLLQAIGITGLFKKTLPLPYYLLQRHTFVTYAHIASYCSGKESCLLHQLLYDLSAVIGHHIMRPIPSRLIEIILNRISIAEAQEAG
jgi:hypothetical protein